MQRVFTEVDPSPVAVWIDNFEREPDPEREIAVYETMAHAYTSYCAQHSLEPAAREEVFALLLLRSGASEEEVLERNQLQHLNHEEALEVLRGYLALPQPVILSAS